MYDDSLQMDGDDASDLVIEIERSFEISLGQDLQHVVTVGDLHNAILDEMSDVKGNACPTSRVFYRVRSLLGAHRKTPATELASTWAGSPRALKKYIERETGWRMPGLIIGSFGCVGMIAAVILALVVGWQVSGLWIPPILGAGIMFVRIDRGTWSGDWATLGSLASGVAAANYATLGREGTRQSPTTAWHALTALIASYGIERRRIGRETRLCGRNRASFNEVPRLS